MKHYLFYLRPSTARRQEGRASQYVAGNQFGRVNPGDVVWTVTIKGGRLVLLSRIPVGEKVKRRAAEARLRSADLWDGNDYLLTPDLLGEVPASLRSPVRTQATVHAGKCRPGVGGACRASTRRRASGSRAGHVHRQVSAPRSRLRRRRPPTQDHPASEENSRRRWCANTAPPAGAVEISGRCDGRTSTISA